MARPVIHGCFHALATLGYIPFTLTSVLIASSSPFVNIPPIPTLLLAFVPSVTIFPLLCFFYRYLDRFEAISLTVQRARIYIMLAGLGLCLLVGGHLLMVHVVSNPHNNAYDKMMIPHAYHTQHTTEVGPSASILRLSIPSTMPMTISAIRKSYTDDNPPKTAGEFQDHYHYHQQCGAGIIRRVQSGSQKQLEPIGPCDYSKAQIAHSTIKRDIRDPMDKTNVSLGDHPFEPEWIVKKRYNNLAMVHLLLFIAAQGFLIALLTTLLLGVLILTEFALDQTDEDTDQQRWHYWSRITGIAFATFASAIHGSYLSGYVLFDGQSDAVTKAAVGMICIYWLSMTWIMNRVTECAQK